LPSHPRPSGSQLAPLRHLSQQVDGGHRSLPTEAAPRHLGGIAIEKMLRTVIE
jgi:hypothetical protein